jgi:subtilisin-like proprotein convertase family protein
MVRPLAVLFCLLLCTHVAFAQEAQWCLRLNDPAPADQYLSVTNKAGVEGNPGYTLEAWVKPTSYANFPTIFGNDYRLSYWLGLSTTGRVRFYPTGGAGNYFESSTIVPLNQWTHIAAVYQTGGGGFIAINGVVDASTSAITGAVGTNPGDLRIGADREVSAAPSYLWQGYLDDLRIWNEARTISQIGASYRIGVGVPLAFPGGAYDALQAGWDFQQGASTYAYDVAYDGTLGSFNSAFYVNAGVADLYYPGGPPVSDNTALHLVGDNGCAKLPLANGFSNGLTLDAWIAPTRLGVYQAIAGRDFRSSFWLGITPTGHVRFYPAGGVGQYFDGNQVIGTGAWTHVAATYRPGNAVIYVNGHADAQSGAFTAPVGENGLAMWVGADDEAGIAGYPYPFEGYLDNVRVSRGVWSVAQVRDRMFYGVEYWPDPMDYTDDTDTPRETWYLGFGQGEAGHYTVEGPNSALTRSGAPLASTPMGLRSSALLDYGFTLRYPAGFASVLPNNDANAGWTEDLLVNQASTISSVRVFVDAQASDLASTTVRLRSPAGNWVELVSAGAALGKDLHTVFVDGWTATLATGYAPFYNGVRPSQPMSAWNGESSLGLWRIELTAGSSGAHVGLWSWGIQVNGAALAVGPDGAGALALENTGAEPVRGSGQLAFTLPADADVRLTLCDVQGRMRRTLVDGPRTAGRYQLGWNAEGLEPGVYFARLRAGGREAGAVRVTVIH